MIKDFKIRAKSKRASKSIHEFTWTAYTEAQARYEFVQGMQKQWDFMDIREASKHEDVIKL